MPTCPVCEQPASYDRLARHERYCTGSDDAGVGAQPFERIDRRIEAVERRMYRRLRALESELEVKRSRTDENGGTNSQSRPRR